jgi:hypothetical protein
MIVVCMAALLRGGWEEKVLAGSYLAACVASLAVETRPWTGPQGPLIAIDAAVLGVAVLVVLRSSKVWPIVAAAFQVLNVGAHLAYIAAEGRLGVAGYLTALAVWSYGTVGAIAWGVSAHLRSKPTAMTIPPDARRSGRRVGVGPVPPGHDPPATGA